MILAVYLAHALSAKVMKLSGLELAQQKNLKELERAILREAFTSR